MSIFRNRGEEPKNEIQANASLPELEDYIAHYLHGKVREFLLAHPEIQIPKEDLDEFQGTDWVGASENGAGSGFVMAWVTAHSLPIDLQELYREARTSYDNSKKPKDKSTPIDRKRT